MSDARKMALEKAAAIVEQDMKMFWGTTAADLSELNDDDGRRMQQALAEVVAMLRNKAERACSTPLGDADAAGARNDAAARQRYARGRA